MANIHVNKSRWTHFCAMSQRFRDSNVSYLFTLKTVIKAIRSGLIRWLILNSITIIVVAYIVLWSHHFRDGNITTLLTLKTYVKVTAYNIRNGVIR